jgi:hypothetical protein
MAHRAGRRSNPAARQASGSCHVKHRHLAHQEFTAAAIEYILDRGRMPDWVPLIAAIRADPNGGVAECTLELCERPLYGAAVFRRVIAAARSRRPGHIPTPS